MFVGGAGDGEWQDGVCRPGQRQQVPHRTQLSAAGEFSYGSTAVFRGNATSPTPSIYTFTEPLARSLTHLLGSFAS